MIFFIRLTFCRLNIINSKKKVSQFKMLVSPLNLLRIMHSLNCLDGGTKPLTAHAQQSSMHSSLRNYVSRDSKENCTTPTSFFIYKGIRIWIYFVRN